MNRLDWGCAFEKHEGWIGSDLIDYGQEHVGSILDGLPWADGYFDMIVSSHSLQMIRFDDLSQALAELRRVLKPDGVLRILVPYVNWVLWLREKGRLGELPISDEIEPTADGKMLRFLFWHGDTRSAFTFESLADTLERAGFASVRRCKIYESRDYEYGDEITKLDSRPDESLVVEARK